MPKAQRVSPLEWKNTHPRKKNGIPCWLCSRKAASEAAVQAAQDGLTWEESRDYLEDLFGFPHQAQAISRHVRVHLKAPRGKKPE